jgi:DNA topoisomerase IA
MKLAEELYQAGFISYPRYSTPKHEGNCVGGERPLPTSVKEKALYERVL